MNTSEVKNNLQNMLKTDEKFSFSGNQLTLHPEDFSVLPGIFVSFSPPSLKDKYAFLFAAILYSVLLSLVMSLQAGSRG